ncbi:MAG TPA: putative porin [Verrucomicrobiae bacterium]|nr:putative porin [Verrucomicrobiae bacterium]
MALIPQTRADAGVDALLNKLEQKGVLSVDEAKELKAENDMTTTNDLAKAMNAKYPMSSWVDSLKFYGSMRGRFDDITMLDNYGVGGPNTSAADRIRFRYRLLFGVVADMQDGLELGFRAGSGEPAPGSGFGGNPNSNNATLQDNFSKKFLYIDAAYGKWTAINDGTWMLAATVGKMDNPFSLSPMVFDPDLTPEGAALQGSYQINDNNTLVFNGGGFMLDELKTSSRDPFLAGAQAIWNAKWGPKWETGLGLSALNIVNASSLTATSAGSNSGVPYVNQGNSRTGAGTLIHDYNPVVADASVTYKMDTFPVYPGVFPVKFAVEYMNNPAVDKQGTGLWAGVTLGKAAKKGSWDISYRYEYLENNAWYDAMVDDDNGALWAVAPAGGGTGFYGGTGIKGHQIKADYMITDGLTFTFTCYINDLIHTVPPGASVVGTPNSGAMHVMADLMWKF